MISVFGGKGFVGSEFARQNSNVFIQNRDDYDPKHPVILNLISTVHNYHVFDNPHLDIETNLNVLINILENARKKFGDDLEFNFISSWFVYGKSILPAKEGYVCNSKGFYSITKKCAEDLLESYCSTFNLKYRIMRLPNVLGVGDSKVGKKKNATQYLMNQILDGEEFVLYYDGEFYRDYIDVRDCAKAIKLVMDRGNFGEVYNISNGVPVRFMDILKLTSEYSEMPLHYKPPENVDFHNKIQVKDFYLDNTKLKFLGYTPEHTIEDTVQWIIDNK